MGVSRKCSLYLNYTAISSKIRITAVVQDVVTLKIRLVRSRTIIRPVWQQALSLLTFEGYRFVCKSVGHAHGVGFGIRTTRGHTKLRVSKSFPHGKIPSWCSCLVFT